MTVYIETSFVGVTYPLTHGRIGYQRAAGVVTANSEAAGFPAVNAGTLRTDSAWRPAVVPASWSITFAAPSSVSYIGIAKHDLGSKNATIAVRYNDGGGITTFPGLGAISPTNDKPIMILVDPRSVTSITITISSADAMPTIAVISAGVVDEMPRPFVWTGQPISEGEQIAFEDTRSQTGNWLGRSVQSQGLQFSLTMQNASEAWRKTVLQDFKVWANGEGAAFFVAARPAGYAEEVAFAWMNDTARASRGKQNNQVSTEVTLNCQGLLTYER